MDINQPFPSGVDAKDYRFGMASDELLRLADMGIPAPDQPLYKPFQETVVRGNLTRVGVGVPSIDWVWDIISLAEINRIIALAFPSITTTYATVYIRTNYSTGDFGGPKSSFEYFSATLWRPYLAGQDGTPITRTNKAFQSLRLQFLNPAVVTP